MGEELGDRAVGTGRAAPAGRPAAARALSQARAATARARRGALPGSPTLTARTLPVARVLVDLPLPHLDRPFDYLVPESMADDAVAGCRVRVRFAGQEVGGFVLERAERSEHAGALAALRRVVSAEPVLSPAVARLSESLAARYAGSRADVLRLAVPPRHARTERQLSVVADPVVVDAGATQAAWSHHQRSGRFLRRLAGGDARPARAVWTARPGEDWPRLLSLAAAVTASAGRGVLLCVPDRRDLDRLDDALTQVLGGGRHVLLAADLGPTHRYRSFLAASRGAVRVVAGTRAAAFAPVRDLGLVALWDDGDDLYAEPRAPYPHAREVLLQRAHEEGCGALVGGFAMTVEGAHLLTSGWAEPIGPTRRTVREHAPRTSITGATDTELARDPFARRARVPAAAHEAIRTGLASGPVLVQTPRRGYTGGLVCTSCRAAARCGRCSGPLAQVRAQASPSCAWCATLEPAWRCPDCTGTALRAPVLGDARTAEELGRAFPDITVVRSSGQRVVATLGPGPALVVATPGAEPLPEAGYAAVVLLDTWLMLARPDLRTAEESLRRWLNAAALARPASRGGRVVAVGDPADPVLQALLRWDPGGFAEREAEERRSAHLPPASRLATLIGGPDAVAEALAALSLPGAAEILGPAPLAGEAGPSRRAPAVADDARRGPEDVDDARPGLVRAVVRVPRPLGGELSRALRDMLGVRSARKLPPVRVQVDPPGLS